MPLQTQSANDSNGIVEEKKDETSSKKWLKNTDHRRSSFANSRGKRRRS